jgi:hypothetical protein
MRKAREAEEAALDARRPAKPKAQAEGLAKAADQGTSTQNFSRGAAEGN